MIAVLRDRRGVALIEFALVAPVMLLLLMGLFDLCHRTYAQAVLSGVVQAAGRKATLEGNSSETSTAVIDQAVVAAVKPVVPNLTWTSKRLSYHRFGDVAAEPFNDTNGNNVYDSGECFSDVNGNGYWDSDAGSTGQGNANDITVYTIKISYPALFPLYKLLGIQENSAISATTVLKNQPYGTQQAEQTATIC